MSITAFASGLAIGLWIGGGIGLLAGAYGVHLMNEKAIAAAQARPKPMASCGGIRLDAPPPPENDNDPATIDNQRKMP